MPAQGYSIFEYTAPVQTFRRPHLYRYKGLLIDSSVTTFSNYDRSQMSCMALSSMEEDG